MDSGGVVLRNATKDISRTLKATDKRVPQLGASSSQEGHLRPKRKGHEGPSGPETAGQPAPTCRAWREQPSLGVGARREQPAAGGALDTELREGHGARCAEGATPRRREGQGGWKADHTGKALGAAEQQGPEQWSTVGGQAFRPRRPQSGCGPRPESSTRPGTGRWGSRAAHPLQHRSGLSCASREEPPPQEKAAAETELTVPTEVRAAQTR